MNKTLVDAGATIKSLREKSGFTQDNIAHYLRVDQSLISKFESGERTLSVDLLEKLATLFGVDMSVFGGNARDIKPLSLALRASEISEEDMETISAINQIALNGDFMTGLLKGGCADG
jgi:transcriptional regulator with XRE-family HTH domain